MTEQVDPPTTEVMFAAPDIRDEDIEAVVRVLRNGWITTGKECEAFEAELADYLGAGIHVVAMASCTAALEIAAAYHRLGQGSRVGVPTWTFASSALAMMRDGATPVLLDVEPDTLNLDPASLQRAIDDGGLDAIVAVHFGGVPVGSEVHDICAAEGIPVIEDAAHALAGVDHRGRIGSSATAGACLSFYATKNLTSGEGGALTTSDPAMADFARSYRLHGLSLDAHARYQPGKVLEYDVVVGGIKANFPDVLAAMARTQLRRLDEMQARRRALVTLYRTALDSIEGVRCIPRTPDPRSADHLMLVVLPDGVDRDAVRTGLNSDGIGTSVHFRPLHTFTWLQDRCMIAPGGVPVADDLRDRVLSLPLHTQLRDSDVIRVCERLPIYLTA